MQPITYSPPRFAPLFLVDVHILDMTATLFRQMFTYAITHYHHHYLHLLWKFIFNRHGPSRSKITLGLRFQESSRTLVSIAVVKQLNGVSAPSNAVQLFTRYSLKIFEALHQDWNVIQLFAV